MLGVADLNPPDVVALISEKPNKFKARKIKCDGQVFGSEVEYRRYAFLRGLEETGVISHLKVHPRYELVPKFRSAAGVCHRAVTFNPDFAYRRDGQLIVEDVKGGRIMADFKIRMKLFLLKHPGCRLYILRERGRGFNRDWETEEF